MLPPFTSIAEQPLNMKKYIGYIEDDSVSNRMKQCVRCVQ